jgi:DNA-binding GntR family transcriptional regulator
MPSQLTALKQANFVICRTDEKGQKQASFSAVKPCEAVCLSTSNKFSVALTVHFGYKIQMTVSLLTLEQLAAEPRPRRSTAAEHAADVLRDAVLSGLLQPGETLRQERLAAALGLSRMPIREAIKLLEAQGLVEFSAHRGAVVARISPDDVQEVFDVRAALEALALRRSIPKQSADTIERAESYLHDMQKARDDISNYLIAHRKFHLTLYADGSSRRLLATIASQFDAAERYLRLESAALDIAANDRQEHQDLLIACMNRDVQAAVDLIGSHVAEAGRELANHMRQRAEVIEVGSAS